VRRHFEEFVNQQNLSTADRNFAGEYQEHGADAPPNSAPGPEGPKQYLAAAFRRFPDIHVTIALFLFAIAAAISFVLPVSPKKRRNGSSQS
jgi:SnoaL-like polyketide cyclase